MTTTTTNTTVTSLALVLKVLPNLQLRTSMLRQIILRLRVRKVGVCQKYVGVCSNSLEYKSDLNIPPLSGSQIQVPNYCFSRVNLSMVVQVDNVIAGWSRFAPFGLVRVLELILVLVLVVALVLTVVVVVVFIVVLVLVRVSIPLLVRLRILVLASTLVRVLVWILVLAPVPNTRSDYVH